MKINPLSAKRAEAETIINDRYAFSFGPKEAAYAHKRRLARDVVAGETPSHEFEYASLIEGMTPLAFAQLILTKPDIAMATEAARRDRILRIRSSETLAEIEAVLKEIETRK